MSRLIMVALLACCAAPFTASARQSRAQSPTAAAPTAPAPQTSRPGDSYESLLARLKGGDRTVDFKALRMAYAESKGYNPYGGASEARRAMFAALNAKKFEEALKQADKALERNYLDIMGHVVAQAAQRELGHADKADFHRFVAIGLVNSILASGDGKKEETAYVVISTDEEYALFQVLGLHPMGQSLAHKDGHSYDVMEAFDQKANRTITYYFNIDRPFNWLGGSLKH